MSGATANGFQMVVAGSQAKSLGDFQITNIQVRQKKKNNGSNGSKHSTTCMTM